MNAEQKVGGAGRRDGGKGGWKMVGGGQVRGHWSVFFMLQIRSRCQWDYSAGVISHPAAPPPAPAVHARATCTEGRGVGGEEVFGGKKKKRVFTV